MSAQHTPGEWNVRFEEVISVDAGGFRLCTLTHLNSLGRRDPEEVAANAHLFAAAKIMLEALEYVMFDCRKSLSETTYDKVSSAIAKATPNQEER